jgi:multicomponent Na+:H+ antiporter subunit G
MNVVADVLTVSLVLAGVLFFAAGAVGLLRFPDTFLRIHASTKADNVGLGLIVLGLMLQAESPLAAGKLLMVWLLALLATTNTGFMIGRRALRQESKEDGG